VVRDASRAGTGVGDPRPLCLGCLLPVQESSRIGSKERGRCLARFGQIDIRAQAEASRARRTDTPRAIRLSVLRSPVSSTERSSRPGPGRVVVSNGTASHAAEGAGDAPTYAPLSPRRDEREQRGELPRLSSAWRADGVARSRPDERGRRSRR
jgi:hypothetical protein